MCQFENQQIFDGLVQSAELVEFQKVLVFSDQRRHDLGDLIGQSLGRNGFRLKAVELQLPPLFFLQVNLVLEIPLADPAEPGFVFQLHVGAGRDGEAGKLDLVGGELVGVHELDQAHVGNAVKLQVVQERLLDDPAGGVVVDDGEEVEGSAEVDARGAEVVDEILHAHQGRLAAERDGGDLVFGGDLVEKSLVAELFGEEDDVGVGAHLSVGGVVVPEADVLVSHDVQLFDQSDHVVHQLGVLVRFRRKRPRPGQRRLDVHVPEGADEFPERLPGSGHDALAELPDDVPHEAGDVDGIVGGALSEILLEPLPRLVVDQLVEVAEAAGFQASRENRGRRHREILAENGNY